MNGVTLSCFKSAGAGVQQLQPRAGAGSGRSGCSGGLVRCGPLASGLQCRAVGWTEVGCSQGAALQCQFPVASLFSQPAAPAFPCDADDLLPLVQRTNNLDVAAPLSGTSLFADCWCIPAAAAGGCVCCLLPRLRRVLAVTDQQLCAVACLYASTAVCMQSRPPLRPDGTLLSCRAEDGEASPLLPAWLELGLQVSWGGWLAWDASISVGMVHMQHAGTHLARAQQLHCDLHNSPSLVAAHPFPPPHLPA